jgi:uncharacterized protein (TIGR03086 family)
VTEPPAAPAEELSQITERYRRRADVFEQLVAQVPPERWDWPSPCTDWDARAVVGHVIGMHAAMLAPLDRRLSPASLAEDPLGAFRSARADVEALLADADVAATVVPTPMGPTSFADHVDQVVSADLVQHGWDLARATGQDDTIDPAELEQLWPMAQAIPEVMRTPGAFGPGIVVYGPVVEVPDDAPLQHRVLGLLGRDPDFVPGKDRLTGG